VEADPSEVNLTAFETFYEEKRPFFMEGRQMLEFDMDGQFLFYSRRIGRPPQLTPNVSAGEYARRPDNTTILGAAKLSGKTADGWSIGLLSSLTEREFADIRSDARSREAVVEPQSAYLVARVQRDFSGGNHSLGAMITGVNRDSRSGTGQLIWYGYTDRLNPFRTAGSILNMI
jgi:hypothetical protein